jgi:hypothetical protein
LQFAFKQGAMRAYQTSCNLLSSKVHCAYHEQVAICFQAMCIARTTNNLQSASKQGAMRVLRASCYLLPSKVNTRTTSKLQCAMCNARTTNNLLLPSNAHFAYEQVAICFQAMCSKLQSASEQVAICFQVDSAFVNPVFVSPNSSYMEIFAKGGVILHISF